MNIFSLFLKANVLSFQNFYFILTVLILFGTHNSIFSICAFVLSLFYIIISKNNHDFIIMAYLMPFSCIFKIGNGLSFYTILLLFCVLKFFLGNFIFFKEMYGFIFFIIFGQLISVNFDFFTTIKFCSGLIFIFYGLNRLNQQQSETCFKAFSLGILISSSCFFLNSDFFQIKKYFSRVGALEGTFGDNLVIRFSGLFNDSNYFSVNLIIALILLVILYYNKKLKFSVLIFYCILCGYFAIITYSKSCFLMFFFPIGLILYANAEKKYIGSFILFFLVIFLFFIYSFFINPSFLDPILNRFFRASDMNELTTGRYDLWIMYIDFFDNNINKLLYGSSISAPLINNAQAHNTYIEILYTCGIIGFVFYIWTIRNMIISNDLIKKKKNFLNYSVLICVIIMYSFLSEFLGISITWHILLSGLVYKSDLTNNGGEYD